MSKVQQYFWAANTVLQTAVNYFPLAVGSSADTITTEAQVSRTVRTAGTMSKYYGRVVTNTTTATSTFVVRKNTADGNETFTVGSGATGEFEDTTNTDSISATDTVSTKVTAGSGGTSIVVRLNGVILDATSNHVCVYDARGFTSSTASTSYYPKINNTSTIQTTETARDQWKMKTAGTWKNLCIYVSANARTTDTVFTSRKNTAAGNMTVTYGSTVTGTLEDTSNTDTLASGDLVNWKIVTGTGTGTITTTGHFSEIVTTNSTSQCMLSSGGQSANANVVRYHALHGRLNNATTESEVQAKAGVAGTSSQYEIYVSANTVTLASTYKIRVGGASVNGSVTMTASTTGWFEDTSNSDAFVETDLLDMMYTGGATGTSLTNQMSGCIITYASGAVTTGNMFLVM